MEIATIRDGECKPYKMQNVDRLVFFIFISLARAQDETESSHEQCVRDHLRKDPSLRERFDDGFLSESCKKSAVWQNAAINGAGRAAATPILTAAQREWADQIFKCFDLRCVCRMFDLCKDTLARIDSTLGNFTNGVEEGAEKLGGLLGAKFPRRKRRRAPVSQVEQLLAQRVGKATRKELRRLTDDERRRFFRVLNTLKTDRIDQMSKYDIMIVQHTAEYSPGAHFGAAFLPFHREFMKNLEVAMRTVDPAVALHYWDSTLDQGLPDPKDSIVWTDEFLGNGNGEVTTGPFSNWTTVKDAQLNDLSPRRRIVRNIGASQFGSLYRESDVQKIMSRNRFRDLVYCVDPFFELTHGANHLWMGGHMNELRISPNDPTFFLLHSFVDYLWEQWRQTKQQYTQRLRDYVTDAEACNQFSYANYRMRPYVIYNSDGLSNQYVEILYNFESRPTCSAAQPDCGSKYLFCHTRNSKCMSKVRLNGNCNGLESFDACHRGQCVGGTCVAKRSPAPTPAPRPQPQPQPQPQPSPTQAGGVTPTIVVTSKDTVWAPITVLSLNGRVAKAYSKAKIRTTEPSSGTSWDGAAADPSTKPYYPGASYAQVRSPYGLATPVRALVNVYDETGRKCAAMCREDGVTYNPCQPTLTLSLDPQLSDGTSFSQNLETAKYSNWQGSSRIPDRLLFLCPVGQSVAPPGASPTAPTETSNDNQAATLPENKGPIRPAATPSFSISTTNSDNKEENLVIKVAHPNNQAGTPSTVGESSPLTNAIAAAASSSLGAQKFVTSDDCRNDHRCCSVWAQVGECKRNDWMSGSCRDACKICTRRQSIDQCVDSDSKCATWAAGGQCKSNDVWMEENCKASCSVCSRSLDVLQGLCGASTNKECINQDQNCGRWAREWECVKNPWWMKENCPEACNYCKKN